MDKIKRILIGIFTFLCMLIIMLDIVCFSLKKVSEHYLKEDTIKKMVNNINIMNLLKDENNQELYQVKQIKEELVDAGIPRDSIDGFLNSKPINDFASDIIYNSIDGILYDKEVTKLNSEYIYNYLEDNMSIISKELQDKNIPNSEYFTKENQDEILIKIRKKAPLIEEKIDDLTTKINNKLEINNNIGNLKMVISIIKILYSNILDIIMIFILVIFIIGIIIIKKSIYKTLKWIAISILSSGIVLYIISILITKLYKYINKLPTFINNLIRTILDDSVTLFKHNGTICFIISIILIIINITVYYILRYIENKKFKQI